MSSTVSNLPNPQETNNEQQVTPWEVESIGSIDYNKLVDQFGASLIDANTLKRFEKLTGMTEYKAYFRILLYYI